MQTPIIKPDMDLGELSAVPAFSAFNDAALKVARICLAMTCDGVALAEVPQAHLEMVRAHAIGTVTGSAPLEVDATFSRFGSHFIHWNKRTGEWSPGVSVPPLACDGRRGGWIFFEVKADSSAKARAMAERYVGCKDASFTGGIVALNETMATVTLNGKKIAY